MREINFKTKDVVDILIIDDHKLVRDGLKIMLESLKKFIHFKIQEAGSGEDALTKIYRRNFDLAIIDYQMPGISGVETIHRILRFKPELKILVLSNYDELSCIQNMIDAGAKGYVLKNIEPPEMLNAIKAIRSDKTYYSNDVTIKLLEFADEKTSQKMHLEKTLTNRQIQVLKMIAMEMTNEEIAQELFVDKRTIDTHRQNLKNKLHVKNTAGLVKAAYKLHLLED